MTSNVEIITSRTFVHLQWSHWLTSRRVCFTTCADELGLTRITKLISAWQFVSVLTTRPVLNVLCLAKGTIIDHSCLLTIAQHNYTSLQHTSTITHIKIWTMVWKRNNVVPTITVCQLRGRFAPAWRAQRWGRLCEMWGDVHVKCSNMRYSGNFITALSFKRQGTNCTAPLCFCASTLKPTMIVSLMDQSRYRFRVGSHLWIWRPQRILKWCVWNEGHVL